VIQMTNDTISRQAALDVLDDFQSNIELGIDDYAEKRKALCDLPSADRPIGHWVLVNRGLDIYMCDQCGEILQIDSVPIWDYCPVCGARMGGETDGRPNKQTGCD